VGANVFAHSKEIILMPRITTSMVKAMILGCNKMEYISDLDAKLHTLDIVPSFVFIDLSSSLFEKGLPSLVQSLVVWFGYLLL
jgi:hypothetical protein